MKTAINKLLDLIKRAPAWVWIVVFSILAYGLLAPWLGFYLDDWYIVFFQKLFGAKEFVQFFANDRPFLAYVYMLFVPIFKDSPLAWQLFAIATHALAGIVFWLLLKKLLPGRVFLTTGAALLFTVYPGFSFQWFSVMYSQVFFMMAVYFLSYILMINGIERRKGRGWWLLGAVVCEIIGIVPQEYFFGLELVRPLVITIMIARQSPPVSRKFKQFILYWLPFLLVALGFTIFRVTAGSQYSYQVQILSQLKGSPVNTIVTLVGKVFWILWDAVVRAWTNLIGILNQNLLSTNGLKLGLIFCVGLLLSLLVLWRRQDETKDWKATGRGLLIGLFASASATIPFLASDYQVSLEFPYNRFLIALAPGAALELAAALDYFLRSHKQKVILCAILLGLAVVSQFDTARLYRQNWKAQGELFQQLYWRAPSIEPGTAIVTDNLPIYLFSSGQSLTAPLNLIFADELDSHELPYALILMSSPQAKAIPSMTPGKGIEYSFRSLNFHGNTSRMLIISQPPNGCVRVFSPESSINEFQGERYEQFWKEAVPLSNLSLISDRAGQENLLLQRYFGNEGTATWCYYYEKAELANQYQRWNETIHLYQEAEGKGLSPLLNREWLPLLRAALHVNDTQTAAGVLDKLLLDNQTTAEDFCILWKEAAPSAALREAFSESLLIAKCE